MEIQAVWDPVMRRLVIATTNKKKGAEMATLLAPLDLQLETLADYPQHLDVVEDGDSFAANARLKATQQAKHLQRWVLAEDSGIAVDALQGAPGIFSARFAGENANDAANNRLLLEKLAGVPSERRTAHYVCHATLCDSVGHVRADAEDVCRGRIVTVPRGEGGFGYDPLFEIAEYHKTFGELGATVKAALSHRSRAIARLIPQLRMLLANGEWPSSD